MCATGGQRLNIIIVFCASLKRVTQVGDEIHAAANSSHIWSNCMIGRDRSPLV